MTTQKIIKFWNHQTVPPRGGWHFTISGETVQRSSEAEIIDAVKKWQVNNGTFTTDEAIESALWSYYCQREPARCLGSQPRAAASTEAAGAAIPAEVTPELQGPPIWGFLNTVAVRWSPGLHRYFVDTCAAISLIFECPNCRAEWLHICTTFPPVLVKSKFEACQWVNKAHNVVNSKVGKSTYPYTRMVSEWGAPTA